MCYFYIGRVWIARLERLDSVSRVFLSAAAFFCRSHALFTGSTSTSFTKNNFKIGSYSTIHTFKNYFVTVFLIFSNKQYSNRPIIC